VLLNMAVFSIAYLFYPVLVYYLALSPYRVLKFHAYWQFFSYFFMHASFSHLLFNMLSLYVFGQAVESRLGTTEFLLFYLGSGVIGGVATFLGALLLNRNIMVLGASGAIFSLMILFACLYPRATIYIFGLIPVRAPYLVLVYFIIEFIMQFRIDSVAHFTHLAGLVTGFFYVWIRFRVNPFKVWKRGYL
jgi:Uncharacterized membrane protein (homolog of Drosophila rhomboid)